MNVIPYARQWVSPEDIRATEAALISEYLTQGPLVQELEKKVAAYCGAKYAVAVNSGTSALHAACFVAGIKPGDEVITSPITFVASANCILYCGGKPVFADIQEEDINIDPKEIEKKSTSKTKAILPVHFAGQPCDLEKIRDIAMAHNLIVIEDACHALGAEYKESKIGACKFSDMAVLSFHAVKHITTGEGGMVLTNNEDYYQKLLMFRTHGITRDPGKVANKDKGAWYYEMQFLGFNYRLTDFQCAMGISQLAKLDQFVERRQGIAHKYERAFKDLAGLRLIKELDGRSSSYHLYVIQVENRREVFDQLRAAGIAVNVHYIPVYWQSYYQELGYKLGLCPKAENYYEKAISLPMFPKLSDDEVDFVIGKVKEHIKE